MPGWLPRRFAEFNSDAQPRSHGEHPKFESSKPRGWGLEPLPGSSRCLRRAFTRPSELPGEFAGNRKPSRLKLNFFSSIFPGRRKLAAPRSLGSFTVGLVPRLRLSYPGLT